MDLIEVLPNKQIVLRLDVIDLHRDGFVSLYKLGKEPKGFCYGDRFNLNGLWMILSQSSVEIYRLPRQSDVPPRSVLHRPLLHLYK